MTNIEKQQLIKQFLSQKKEVAIKKDMYLQAEKELQDTNALIVKNLTVDEIAYYINQEKPLHAFYLQ